MMLDRYENLLNKSRIFFKEKVEKNIFSLGGRGHYENPITDLLAFFINPNEEHGLNDLFLRSLFQVMQLQEPASNLCSPPTREQYTEQGNRIDLIIEGDGWVVVVENKIWHQAVNPFDDYVQYARSCYANKKAYFVLLSLCDEQAPQEWQAITWKSYIDTIKSNIEPFEAQAKNLKWQIFAREYLANIENEYGEKMMDSAKLDFIKHNYQDLLKFGDMLDEYTNYMAEQGLLYIRDAAGSKRNIAFSKRHNWGEFGIALRLISEDWGGKTNITLVLRKDGSLRLQIYVYEVADEQIPGLKAHMDSSKYTSFWTEAKTIQCFGYYDEKSHDKIFQEIQDLAIRLNRFYAKV